VFELPGLSQAAVNTFVISIVSATLATALAIALANLSVRPKFKGSHLLLEVAGLAYGIPAVVLATAILFLYLFVPLPIYGTVWVIIIGYVTHFLPRASRMMQAALLQLDVELEDVGRAMGASGFTVTRKIMLPLVWPSVSRTWLWVFAHAIGELPIALLLASGFNTTLVVMLWQLFEDNASYTGASALATLLMLVSGVLVWFVNRGGMRETRG
jgi:iron(III) transport system permease protein